MEKSGNCPLRDFPKKAQYRNAVLWELPGYGVITRKMSDVTDDNSETTLPVASVGKSWLPEFPRYTPKSNGDIGGHNLKNI